MSPKDIIMEDDLDGCEQVWDFFWTNVVCLIGVAMVRTCWEFFSGKKIGFRPW